MFNLMFSQLKSMRLLGVLHWTVSHKTGGL